VIAAVGVWVGSSVVGAVAVEVVFGQGLVVLVSFGQLNSLISSLESDPLHHHPQADSAFSSVAQQALVLVVVVVAAHSSQVAPSSQTSHHPLPHHQTDFSLVCSPPVSVLASSRTYHLHRHHRRDFSFQLVWVWLRVGVVCWRAFSRTCRRRRRRHRIDWVFCRWWRVWRLGVGEWVFGWVFL
jgi:hypothetical protein